MDPVGDVRIFRVHDRAGGTRFVAYRLLHTKYLVLLFADGVATTLFASFSEVTELVPVGGLKLHLRLDIGDDLEATMELWRVSILAHILDDLCGP